MSREISREKGAPAAPKRVRLPLVKEDGDWKLRTFTVPTPPTEPGKLGGDDEGAARE